MQWRNNLHNLIKKILPQYKDGLPGVIVDSIDSAYVAGLDDQKEEFIARLTVIISDGAPSEQENPLKYGVKIWNDIHKLIQHYEDRR